MYAFLRLSLVYSIYSSIRTESPGSIDYSRYYNYQCPVSLLATRCWLALARSSGTVPAVDIARVRQQAAYTCNHAVPRRASCAARDICMCLLYKYIGVLRVKKGRLWVCLFTN